MLGPLQSGPECAAADAFITGASVMFCRIMKPGDKLHVVWVTTEGGDFDNAALQAYKDAMHSAKVPLPFCFVFCSNYLLPSLSLHGCVQLLLLAFCHGLMFTTRWTYRFVLVSMDHTLDLSCLHPGRRQLFFIWHQIWGADCRWHTCCCQQAGCRHLSDGHFWIWVNSQVFYVVRY